MMGHLNCFLAWGGGNWNNNFKKSKMPGDFPGGSRRFDLTDALQCGLVVFLNPIWVP